MNRLLLEALSSSIASQASHTFPTLGGAVPSLALHYGMDWAGDEAYKRLKKHPKLRKGYDKVFHSHNPKQRPGKFASDLASVGATAGGIHLASKIKNPKARLIAQLLGGVAGHTAGRLAGNKLGHRINQALYKTKHKKMRENFLTDAADTIARKLHDVKAAYKEKKLAQDVAPVAEGVKKTLRKHYRTTTEAKKSFARGVKKIRGRFKVAVDGGIKTPEAAATQQAVKGKVDAAKTYVKDTVSGPLATAGKVGAGLALTAGAVHVLPKALRYLRKTAKPVATAVKQAHAPQFRPEHLKQLAGAAGAGGLAYLALRRRRNKDR